MAFVILMAVTVLLGAATLIWMEIGDRQSLHTTD